jgi:hypothetical protein
LFNILQKDKDIRFNFPSPTFEKTKVGDILDLIVDAKYTISDKLWEGHQRRKQIKTFVESLYIFLSTFPVMSIITALTNDMKLIQYLFLFESCKMDMCSCFVYITFNESLIYV